MLYDISPDKQENTDSNAPAGGEQLARQRAIQRIEHRRRFRIRATMGTLGMIILVGI